MHIIENKWLEIRKNQLEPKELENKKISNEGAGFKKKM